MMLYFSMLYFSIILGVTINPSFPTSLGNVAYGCRAAPGVCSALAARGDASSKVAVEAVRGFVWRQHCEENGVGVSMGG